MDDPGHDVIGDVHGHADRLVELLRQLGYDDASGVWRHPVRTAVFVGDLIDRGPAQLETVRIARTMVDAAAAQVVLGNHEFNAVAYATVDPSTLRYCRSHDADHHRQHQAFLDAVGFDTPLHRSVLEWFGTIPLWLELDGVDVVHACWSRHHMDALAGVLGPGNTLTERAVIEGARPGNPIHDAVEVLLKGPELSLDGLWYRDQGQKVRRRARARWWATAGSLREAVWLPPDAELFDADDRPVDAVSDRDLTEDERFGGGSDVPVLVGHYWWRRNYAEPAVTSRWACLDHSVAKDGHLAAYRWNHGDTELSDDRLVFA